MKEMKLENVKVMFWYEGNTLFWRLSEMGSDIYCCGNKQMPETEEEAIRLIETSWMW